MKTIKSILIVLFLVLSSMVFAQHVGSGHRNGQQFEQQSGQQGPPPAPNASQIKKMVSDLSTETSLSAEQETKILKIYTNHFTIVKDKTSGNKRPPRSEMEALHTVLEKNIKAVLTDEQFKKYENYTKKQKHHGPPR